MRTGRTAVLGILAGTVMGMAGSAALRAEGSAAPAYAEALIEVRNAERFRSDHAARIPATLALLGGRNLTAGGEVEAREGEPPSNRAVILQLPSMEQARAWYDSAAYAEIRLIRHAVATTRSSFIEGRSPPPQ